jgi:hypothetical protein
MWSAKHARGPVSTVGFPGIGLSGPAGKPGWLDQSLSPRSARALDMAFTRPIEPRK